MSHSRRRLSGPLLLCALLASSAALGFSLLPDDPVFSGGPIDVPATLYRAGRWSAIAGLADGIQVGVAPGFAAALGAGTPTEVQQVRDAVLAAFAGWASPVLSFDVTFGAAGVVDDPGQGYELDLIAVPGSHPLFLGTSFFGIAPTERFFSAVRPLTNGESAAGFVIEGADVLINLDNLAGFAAIFGLTQQEQLDGLTRLVMHEVGHAIGLGHSNGNNPFGVFTFYDDDLNPFNPLLIPAVDPFGALFVSANRNDQAVMSNRPCGEPLLAPCPALFATTASSDDLGGRDTLYPLPACRDGVDSDGDGLVDLGDPGCDGPDDLSERTPLLMCDNGLDDDSDTYTDFPEDPGCASVFGVEPPACQNGMDDDGDGGVDFDGGASIYGSPIAAADPQCQSAAGIREKPDGQRCGLGFEIGPLLAGLAALRRRRAHCA